MNRFSKQELSEFIRSMYRVLEEEGVSERGDDVKVDEAIRRITEDETTAA
jgi:hypothetical protein